MSTEDTSELVTTRILRRRAVLELINVSEPTLWRMERDGLFPRHVRISQRAVGYVERDVLQWIAGRQQVA